MPTVHNYRAPPIRRSIADPTNYGDEPGAAALIRPQRFGLSGVSDDEFLLLRPRAEIRSLVTGAGYDLSDEDFEVVWNAATEQRDGEQGHQVELCLCEFL